MHYSMMNPLYLALVLLLAVCDLAYAGEKLYGVDNYLQYDIVDPIQLSSKVVLSFAGVTFLQGQPCQFNGYYIHPMTYISDHRTGFCFFNTSTPTASQIAIYTGISEDVLCIKTKDESRLYVLGSVDSDSSQAVFGIVENPTSGFQLVRKLPIKSIQQAFAIEDDIYILSERNFVDIVDTKGNRFPIRFDWKEERPNSSLAFLFQGNIHVPTEQKDNVYKLLKLDMDNFQASVVGVIDVQGAIVAIAPGSHNFIYISHVLNSMSYISVYDASVRAVVRTNSFPRGGSIVMEQMLAVHDSK